VFQFIGVNPGGLGIAAPRFWAGDRGRVAEKVVGGRGRVVKYY